jgi:hypothetical protein
MNVTQSIRPLLKVDWARNKKLVVRAMSLGRSLKRDGIPDRRAG